MWQNMLTLLMLPVGWGVQKHMDKIKKYIQSKLYNPLYIPTEKTDIEKVFIIW